jgi:8-oxo-dGTP pyrophosphatase MutT (NUDIX family)
MGAGILPVCLHRSQLYFLFGKETSSGLWSDFGGRSEQRETQFETAIREGGEELNGFLGENEYLRERVKKGQIYELYYDSYTIYIFKIPYDKNLPRYFNLNHKFIENHLSRQVTNNRNGLFEKSEIRWFSFDDLRNQRHFFRPFYRPIADILRRNYNELLVSTRNL